VQGEVKDPSRTYPRALAFALPLVTIGYFVPLLTTLGASDWTTWTEGGWPQIAASAAGSAARWLAIWIALGGMISALALFKALLLGYSRIPFVLAGDGLLPKALAKLGSACTPRMAIIVSLRLLFDFRSCRVRKLIVCRCCFSFGCALSWSRRR
jgi:amino acid transporter